MLLVGAVGWLVIENSSSLVISGMVVIVGMVINGSESGEEVNVNEANPMDGTEGVGINITSSVEVGSSTCVEIGGVSDVISLTVSVCFAAVALCSSVRAGAPTPPPTTGGCDE